MSKRYSNKGSGRSRVTTTNRKDAKYDFTSQYDYAKLLRNPLQLDADVRIPDGLALIPTCTFDINHEFDLPVAGADGVTGFLLGLTAKPTLYTCKALDASGNIVWTPTYITHTTGVSVAGGTVFTQTTKVKDPSVVPSEEFWDAVDTQYRGWRLVAAGYKLEFVGNDTNNQGVVQACQINGGIMQTTAANSLNPSYDLSDYAGDLSTGQQRYVEGDVYVENISDWNGAQFSDTDVTLRNKKSSGATIEMDALATIAANGPLATKIPILNRFTKIDQIRNTYASITKPVKDGLMYTYLPRGPNDLKYRRANTNSDRTVSEGNTGSWAVWDFTKQTGTSLVNTALTSENTMGPLAKYCQVGDTGNGALLCVVSGAPTTQSYKVRIVLHYEALPESAVNLYDSGKIAIPNVNATNAAAIGGGGGGR